MGGLSSGNEIFWRVPGDEGSFGRSLLLCSLWPLVFAWLKEQQGSEEEWALSATCHTPPFYNFPKVPGFAFKTQSALLSPITPAKLQLGLNHCHLHRGFICALGEQLEWALLYQCQIFEQLLVIYRSSSTGTGSTEKQTRTSWVQLAISPGANAAECPFSFCGLSFSFVHAGQHNCRARKWNNRNYKLFYSWVVSEIHQLLKALILPQLLAHCDI